LDVRKRSVILAAASAAVVAAAAVAGALYLARGDRYRLYTDDYARHCWTALQRLAVSSSSPSPTRVVVEVADAGRPVEVSIGYTLGRVLAGAVLEATCTYREGADRATAIELNGMPLDPQTLEEINAALME